MLRLICIALFSAGLAVADVQTGVVRSGGQPIPGAAVIAECGADRIETVTDGEGRFEMGGLPSTPCTFRVAMFGFDRAEQAVKASSSPLAFDLKLQARATVPAVAPSKSETAVAAVKPAEQAPSSSQVKPASPPSTPSQPTQTASE